MHEERQRRTGRTGLWLTLILVFAAGLRLWYALPDLHGGRFWDERYNFENVAKILETWSFEPARTYYPSPVQSWPQALTLAASQWLSERLGVDALATVRPGPAFTPTAYLLVRCISILYGLATLPLLFAVGRRMFSPAVGLIAALALAATPWHIHATSKFKPDALLVLTVVLAFYWSLAAIERARARDYALAGFGICLAMSAKVMGGLVALPLAFGTLLVGWRDRRRLGLLLLAAVTSLATFLALNPYARYYLRWVAHLQDDYAMRANWQGMSRATMPAEMAAYLFGPTVHGPLVGALAVAGLVVLAASLRSSRLTQVARAERAMLVVFPVLYAVAYGASTPYFKGNNVLPIVPFTTLAAVWLVLAISERAAERRPALGGRVLRPAVILLLAAVVATPGVLYVYRSLTPTTLDAAQRFLAGGTAPRFGRVFFAEEIPIGGPTWEWSRNFLGGESALVTVDRLDELPGERLDLSDGELFPARRLHGPQGEFYRHRMERARSGRVTTFEPRRFEQRGPALVAIRHRRRPAGDWIALPMEPCPGVEEGCYTAPLPAEVEAGDLVSLAVRIPFKVISRDQVVPPVRVGDVEVPLVESSRGDKAVQFVTERFRVESAGAAVSFTSGQPRNDRARMSVVVNRWR